MLRALWYYFWVAPHLLLGLLLYVLWVRRLWRQFPIFSFYAAYELVQFTILLVMSLSKGFGPAYFHVYSATLALSTAVRFGVIDQLFQHFFNRYPLLAKAGKLVFRGTIVVLLPLAALALSGRGGPDMLWNATFALGRALLVVQCGLLISLFLFSRYFGLQRRSRAFGIALGIGIDASVELALAAVRYYSGVNKVSFDLISMGTYHVCVLIWLYYFWNGEKPQRPPAGPPLLPEEDLALWNSELERLL